MKYNRDLKAKETFNKVTKSIEKKLKNVDSEIISNLTKKVSNGDIFLFHDSNKKYTNTLSSIDVIIPTLKKKGFKWVTISKLLEK